jgi:HK97 family phage portal protein
VPLKLYERMEDNDRRRLRPQDHPLAAALENPWQRAGQIQLVEHLLAPLLVHGNGTIQIESGVGGKILFRPRYWQHLSPIQPFFSEISGWESNEDDSAEVISAGKVLHVARWNPSGPIGVSPLHQLGVTLAIEKAAQVYAANSMKNMARPPSAITISEQFMGYDRDVREDIISSMRSQVNELYTGEGAGSVAILPTGVDWKGVGHTAVEAELINQRKVNREEIASVYQVDPQMLGIMDATTYSNLESAYNHAYSDSLGPYLKLIAGAINSQIIQGLLGEDNIYCEFDLGPVLEGDRAKELAAFQVAINSGLMTINEARTALNLAKVDDQNADQLFIATNNLTPLSQLDQTTTLEPIGTP